MEKTPRTFVDWVVASRPWSFTASLIPIIAVSVWFFWKYQAHEALFFDWPVIPLAMGMLMLMQAAGNLIGDYYDHKNGVDLPGSLNGVRHIQSGKFTPREILYYGFFCLALSAVLGVAILWRCGPEALWIGLAGVVMVILYPWLKSHALGDVDVLLGFALLPALGLCYALSHRWIPESMLIILPVGFITVAILHANNTRDIDNDQRAGLSTFCIRIGLTASKWVYAFEVFAPYVLVLVFWSLGLVPALSLLTLLTLPLAVQNSNVMFKSRPHHAEDLATLDHRTALHQMLFGILYTLSFLGDLLIG